MGLGLGLGRGLGLGFEAVRRARDVGEGAGRAGRVVLGAQDARRAGWAGEAVRLHLPPSAVAEGARRAACGHGCRLRAEATQLALLAILPSLEGLVLSCLARVAVGQAGLVALAAGRALLRQAAAAGAPVLLRAGQAVFRPRPALRVRRHVGARVAGDRRPRDGPARAVEASAALAKRRRARVSKFRPVWASWGSVVRGSRPVWGVRRRKTSGRSSLGRWWARTGCTFRSWRWPRRCLKYVGGGGGWWVVSAEQFVVHGAWCEVRGEW